jgi:hypothetical protein
MTTSEPLGNAPTEPSAAAATLPPSPLPTKQIGLALAALIIGIGAFLFGLVPVFGALVGITGVVLGVLALRKRQSKGLAIAGIILGGIGALSSIGITVGLGAAVNYASTDKPPAAIAQSAEPTTEQIEEADSESPAPEAEAEAEAPAVPPEYESALIKATSYSELMNMSKVGIYDQLVSEYGEQFSPEAAQYAVDNMQADWNANALAKAKSYQEDMAMAPEAIRDQLTSEYGEKFTVEEADYAIQHLND